MICRSALMLFPDLEKRLALKRPRFRRGKTLRMIDRKACRIRFRGRSQLEVMAFALGLGMIASLYNVIYRDVSYLVGIGMQILFYSTPIVYQLTDIPEKIGPVPVRALVEASPLTQYVIQSRQVMYLLEFPSVRQIGYTFACSVIVLLFGWWVFSRRAADVIEEI